MNTHIWDKRVRVLFDIWVWLLLLFVVVVSLSHSFYFVDPFPVSGWLEFVSISPYSITNAQPTQSQGRLKIWIRWLSFSFSRLTLFIKFNIHPIFPATFSSSRLILMVLVLFQLCISFYFPLLPDICILESASMIYSLAPLEYDCVDSCAFWFAVTTFDSKCSSLGISLSPTIICQLIYAVQDFFLHSLENK